MSQGRRGKLNTDLKIARVVLILFLLAGFFNLSFQLMAARVQGNARLASCQFNMKQLGLAMAQYAEDSDSRLPLLVNRSGTQTWRETLYPYVKSVGVYRCPDDVYTRQLGNSPQSLPRSYAANQTGWDKAVNKSSVIMLVDVCGDDGPAWDMTSPFYAQSSALKLYLHKPANPIFFKRPSATLNVLLTDGHVKRVAPEDTLEPINLWAWNNALLAGQDLANARAILTHAENE